MAKPGDRKAAFFIDSILLTTFAFGFAGANIYWNRVVVFCGSGRSEWSFFGIFLFQNQAADVATEALFREAVVLVQFKETLRVEGAPIRETGVHILSGDDVVLEANFLQQREDILLYCTIAVE